VVVVMAEATESRPVVEDLVFWMAYGHQLGLVEEDLVFWVAMAEEMVHRWGFFRTAEYVVARVFQAETAAWTTHSRLPSRRRCRHPQKKEAGPWEVEADPSLFVAS